MFAVQVNQRVCFLCKVLDCCCPIQIVVDSCICYVNSISLVRNE